jgi:hypothetical protein
MKEKSNFIFRTCLLIARGIVLPYPEKGLKTKESLAPTSVLAPYFCRTGRLHNVNLTIKSITSWGEAPYSLVEFYLLPPILPPRLLLASHYSSTLNKEAVRHSETSINLYQTTRHYIQAQSTLQSPPCEPHIQQLYNPFQ